jgi:hypothetical protein
LSNHGFEGLNRGCLFCATNISYSFAFRSPKNSLCTK